MIKLFLACLALFVEGAAAADFFISPNGAGNADGSTSANAAAGASANSIFNDKMVGGDRLLLGAGTYQNLSLSLTKGGEPGKPKTIIGEKGAVFSSNWTIEAPDKGATAITLGNGLSNVSIQDLSIKNYCFAVRGGVSKEGPRANLSFQNIAIEQVRHGFYLSDCNGLVIENCNMKRYSKHGFRFDQGCNDVRVSKCVADCSEGDAVWETKTEVFPFGFNVNSGGSPNSKLRFEDCVAKNNIKSNQTVKYTNGDGFVVEGNSTDVTFTRCHAFRNQDGGFDLKVKDVKLVDCIATGHRRDFRIWTTGTLENCFAGWSSTGLWGKGGPVAVKNSTFVGHKKSALEIENEATAPATLTNCLIAADPANKDFQPKLGKVELSDATVTTLAEAKFTKPDPTWDGTGRALDSTKFPAKGFSSTRVSR